jgi:streptogramin lyase
MLRNTKVQMSALLGAVLVAGGLLALHWAQPSSAGLDGDASDGFAGKVQVAGSPIAGSTVTLYAAGDGKPVQLAQGKTGDDGSFKLDVGAEKLKGAEKKVLYLVARGGTPKGAAAKGANDAIALLSVLGTKLPKTATVNELTTVASAFTSAQFLNGEALSGKPLGLRIAAGNAPNLVDPETGGWGKVILDPLNSTQTTTLANLNTLGSLLSAFYTVADDGWRARFLKAATPPDGATPKSTLEATANIARRPWANAKELYTLFDEAYPQPQNALIRRKAPFAPYLAYPPKDFALSLCFSGGGNYAAGRLMFDAEGNLWSGQNWLPGSQSGVIHNIGGGTIKFAPNGTALSPPITGFTGMGVDGIGWGTGVALDKVWVTSFNGAIGVMDFNGNPLGKESDFPMAGKVGGLQGVGIAANGDVWIADAVKDQLLHFPGGRVKDGRLVQVKGLVSPFSIVIDVQNRVWVSNALDATIVRFPADDPSKAESISAAGISVRGIALDSKGNVWTASLMNLDFPPPVIPKGASIMEQFQIAGLDILTYVSPTKPTGVIQMTRPDGTHPAPKGFSGLPINVPWGLSIDGKDDVWFGNFYGRGVILMAGEDTKGHPLGTKAGDVIHQFQSSSTQMITEVAIDPAGNVWAANNWNNQEAVMAYNPDRPTSTWGGGSGITVIYGVAAPVKTPLLGTVRKP